jgi:multimeric flavodoxin WrbA
MKALAILGTRSKNGQTAAATQALIDGLAAEGVQTETLFLPATRLESCRQCEDTGWGLCATEGRCVIDDGYAGIVEKIGTADLVIFATPVYYGDLSESMRVLTDRLRRVFARTRERTGENRLFKPAIGICVAGGGGGGSETCLASLKKVLSTCGLEALDMVPVRRQNLPVKKKMLEVLGRWLPGHIASGEWERVIPRPAGRR